MAHEQLQLQYIDVHCHLTSHEFDNDRDDVITRAKQHGVRACVVVSEFKEDFERVLSLATQHPDFVFPCLGWHPVQKDCNKTNTDQPDSKLLLPSWRSVEPSDVDLMLIREHCDRIVGIGEVCIFLCFM